MPLLEVGENSAFSAASYGRAQDRPSGFDEKSMIRPAEWTKTFCQKASLHPFERASFFLRRHIKISPSAFADPQNFVISEAHLSLILCISTLLGLQSSESFSRFFLSLRQSPIFFPSPLFPGQIFASSSLHLVFFSCA